MGQTSRQKGLGNLVAGDERVVGLPEKQLEALHKTLLGMRATPVRGIGCLPALSQRVPASVGRLPKRCWA